MISVGVGFCKAQRPCYDSKKKHIFEKGEEPGKSRKVGSMHVTCVKHNIFEKPIASFSNKALLSFNRLLLQMIIFGFMHALHTRSTFNCFSNLVKS